MNETIFTRKIMDTYGHLPASRHHNGWIFHKNDRKRVAVLGTWPIHKLDGGVYSPWSPTWDDDSNGRKGNRFLQATIGADGLGFNDSPYTRIKPLGVGLYWYGTEDIVMLAEFRPGLANAEAFIHTENIYEHKFVLHEKGQVKEFLEISEKPANLDGDLLCIVSRLSRMDNSVTISGGTASDSNGKNTPVVQFEKQNGNTSLLLSGISVEWLDTATYPVVIDPTYQSQPDATAGLDTFGKSNGATTNYSTETYIRIGEDVGTTTSWLKWDYSSMGGGAEIDSMTIGLYLYSSQHETEIWARWYRLLVAFIENQATWNVRVTGTNWTVAGGLGSGTDRSTTIAASKYYAASAPSYGFWNASIDLTEAQLNYETNNGWELASDGTDNNDVKFYYSSDYTTAANRPIMTIEYTAPVSWFPQIIMF